MEKKKPEEKVLRPYEKVHILISSPTDKAFEVIEHIEKLRYVEGIEIEKSANG